MILNSRPLSYVSTDDMEEPLMPSHLLIGCRVLRLPMYSPHEDLDYGLNPSTVELTQQMHHFNKTLDQFWKQWKTEYLVELRECHRYHNRTKGLESIVSVGDLVLLHDQDRPRGLWKLAIIKSVIKGSDGHIRGAAVRTQSDTGRTSVLKSSIK